MLTNSYDHASIIGFPWFELLRDPVHRRGGRTECARIWFFGSDELRDL